MSYFACCNAPYLLKQSPNEEGYFKFIQLPSNFVKFSWYRYCQLKGGPNSLILVSLGLNFMFQNIEIVSLSKQFNLGRLLDRQKNKRVQQFNLGSGRNKGSMQIGKHQKKNVCWVCKSKCTPSKRRKNARKIGWVGSSEVVELLTSSRFSGVISCRT